MSEIERDYDHTFVWEGVEDQPSGHAVRDMTRVGLVLVAALVLLAGMTFVLLSVLGDMFGDMWNSVFTF